MSMVGFVIANDDEEYLHEYRDKPRYSVREWSKIPDLAKVFPTYKQALKLVEKARFRYRTWILEYHDFGERLGVIYRGENPPPWLSCEGS